MKQNVRSIVVTQSETVCAPPHQLVLESGRRFGPITIAYEMYGTLNADKTNAILICHALSGDAHAAGYNAADDEKPGWWDTMIGPGKGFDTDTYCVICSNVIGGCKGSSGPNSMDPATGKPYGLTFPFVTIPDMVCAQKALIDQLGIRRLAAVSGGSMGGMQALQWTIAYPDSVASAIIIASAARLSPQAIAFNEVGRQAIMADVNWKGGNYYGTEIPAQGLSIARMIGHITYLSESSMNTKFGRQLIDKENYNYDFSRDFQVESYLHYKGSSFVKRFDANSYLYISKAMDYFDLSQTYGSLAEAFARVSARYLIVSFSSDWLFPPHQSEEIAHALMRNAAEVSYSQLESSYGHDAFLVEDPHLRRLVRNFLQTVPSRVRA